MDDLEQLTRGPNAALVIFSFLQADCRNPHYSKELLSLGKDLDFTPDINCKGPRIHSLDDGYLETDGHLPIRQMILSDIQPSVELQWPRDHVEAATIREVALGLREIATRLEDSIVSRATQNLRRNILASSYECKRHLAGEVERLMNRGVGLEHLPQERVMVVLTLTLVKGVCEQAPQLLRTLFAAALEYIRRTGTR
ncbi:BH3 interacting domain death agonist isoform X2 [Embiotoca jacksoni]|uniref:BH3 interacting domain death agonist isoform X2 n=1 Tax=Embiotoca jacksoni TaxID=100190 RepID=UPI003703D1FA